MARRSHQETFILLRNNSLKNRSFYKNFNGDDERSKLVDGFEETHDDIELNSSDRHSDCYGPNLPTWLSSLDEFRYNSFSVTQKIEQLKQLQEDHLKQQNTVIFGNEMTAEKMRQFEQQIDQKCKELSALFTRMHSILTNFKSLKTYPTSKSRLLNSVIRNIFQYQVQEVVRLTQLFRSCQRIYMERRNEACKVDREFVITFDEDALFDELTASWDSTPTAQYNGQQQQQQIKHMNHHDQSIFFDNSPSDSSPTLQASHGLNVQSQIVNDMSINKHLKERQKEMDTIMKSFVELNQMFQEVNNFVVDHGSALDRIDFNIEQVEHRVELGAVSLEKAHRKIARMRKIKFMLGSGVIVFLLFLLIVLRS